MEAEMHHKRSMSTIVLKCTNVLKYHHEIDLFPVFKHQNMFSLQTKMVKNSSINNSDGLQCMQKRL